MKRSGSLRRASGIKRHTTLRRVALDGAVEPLGRRTPLRPMSDKRRHQSAARRAAEAALGRVGTQGLCARCGRRGYVNGHERLARSQGGDPTRPDCLLCIGCNEWCTEDPPRAAWDGWTVSRKWPADPTLQPGEARTVQGRVVYLEVNSGKT